MPAPSHLTCHNAELATYSGWLHRRQVHIDRLQRRRHRARRRAGALKELERAPDKPDGVVPVIGRMDEEPSEENVQAFFNMIKEHKGGGRHAAGSMAALEVAAYGR